MQDDLKGSSGNASIIMSYIIPSNSHILIDCIYIPVNEIGASRISSGT